MPTGLQVAGALGEQLERDLSTWGRGLAGQCLFCGVSPCLAGCLVPRLDMITRGAALLAQESSGPKTACLRQVSTLKQRRRIRPTREISTLGHDTRICRGLTVCRQSVSWCALCHAHTKLWTGGNVARSCFCSVRHSCRRDRLHLGPDL